MHFIMVWLPNLLELLVIIKRTRVNFVRLPGRIVSLRVHQTPIETRSLLVPPIFSVAIAEDEITTLFMQVIVMLASGWSAPFGRAGGGPSVPLRVSIGRVGP